MSQRLAIRVAYIASEEYHGYQKQPNKRTIEDVIEQALQQAELPATFGTRTFASSGRTDRGVSALKQTISFDVPADVEVNLMRINAYLPPGIQLWAAARVPSDFHPRYDAVKRQYHYFYPLLPTQKDVLNFKMMKECLEMLKGTHDFQNFAKTDETRKKKTIRTIDEATISTHGNSRILVFKFASSGFLWQQVRRMVNHVLQVGLGAATLDDTEELLTKNKNELNPRLIPAPAPPEGLILSDVRYRQTIQFFPCIPAMKTFFHRMKTHLQILMMKSHVLEFAMAFLLEEMNASDEKTID